MNGEKINEEDHIGETKIMFTNYSSSNRHPAGKLFYLYVSVANFKKSIDTSVIM